jgi:phosphoribosyl-AMP cyclohydrolase
MRYAVARCSPSTIITPIIFTPSGGERCDLVDGPGTSTKDQTKHQQPRPLKRGGVFFFMDYSKLDGLIPAVVQDADSSEVLMVGFMNEQALADTRRTGFATFFSRSRNKLWMKGETSGNKLAVVDLLVDCDDDTVLVKVKRLGDGNVCHTGERTCFFRRLADSQ